MEPPTIPTKSFSESSAREAEHGGVVGVDGSHDLGEAVAGMLAVSAGSAGAPATQPSMPAPLSPASAHSAPSAASPASPASSASLGVEAETLQVDCLPAGWLEWLDLSARRIVVRDLAAGVAVGFTPSLIRSRLSANALPPADRVRIFLGLVIHRVSNALSAPREPSAEERAAARWAAEETFVEQVLAGMCTDSLGAQYNRMIRLSASGWIHEDERREAAYEQVMEGYRALTGA